MEFIIFGIFVLFNIGGICFVFYCVHKSLDHHYMINGEASDFSKCMHKWKFCGASDTKKCKKCGLVSAIY